MVKKFLLFWLTILIGFSFTESVSHADIYKWKDENGVWHFTQTPPETGENQVIKESNYIAPEPQPEKQKPKKKSKKIDQSTYNMLREQERKIAEKKEKKNMALKKALLKIEAAWKSGCRYYLFSRYLSEAHLKLKQAQSTNTNKGDALCKSYTFFQGIKTAWHECLYHPGMRHEPYAREYLSKLFDRLGLIRETRPKNCKQAYQLLLKHAQKHLHEY